MTKRSFTMQYHGALMTKSLSPLRPGTSLVAAVLVPLLATGCATKSGVIDSLEDLSTEAQKEGFSKVPQYRVASVPGWLPFSDVGTLYFYKPNRKPGSVIGLSPGQSFELISESAGTCDLANLKAVRNKVVDLNNNAVEVVQDRLELTNLMARQMAGDTAASLGTDIDAARKALKAAQTQLNTSYADVVKSIDQSGAFVYRWTTDTQTGGGLGLSSLLGASGHKEDQHTGFALVCGLRIRTLFVGNDLLKAWPDLNMQSRFGNRFELTTHLMQARHIVYGHTSDISEFAQAKLKASYAQLAALPETLKQLDQIEIEMASAKVNNLSNIGVMSGMTRRLVPVKWDQASMEARLAQFKESPDQANWLTFYSVQTHMRHLLDLLSPTNVEAEASAP